MGFGADTVVGVVVLEPCADVDKRTQDTRVTPSPLTDLDLMPHKYGALCLSVSSRTLCMSIFTIVSMFLLGTQTGCTREEGRPRRAYFLCTFRAVLQVTLFRENDACGQGNSPFLRTSCLRSLFG